jgi:hypothetical protein
VAIKTDSCCRIRNTSVETSVRKVLHLTLCMYVIAQSFVSETIFDIVSYCTLYAGTLFTGTKSTCIGDQLLPNRGRYGTLLH